MSTAPTSDEYCSYPFPDINDNESLGKSLRTITQQSKFYSMRLYAELAQLRTFKLWAIRKLQELREKLDERRNNDKVIKRVDTLQDAYSFLRNLTFSNERTIDKIGDSVLRLERLQATSDPAPPPPPETPPVPGNNDGDEIITVPAPSHPQATPDPETVVYSSHM